MKSIKCPQCGLVYWATNASCKRCGMANPDATIAEPNYLPTQYMTDPPLPPVNFAAQAEKDRLLKRLKRGSIYFYVIGGLQILLWLAIGQFLIVEAAFNIIVAFLAYKFRSRFAALCLLGLTLLAVLSGIVLFAEGTRPAFFSPIGIIIRLLVAGRMVQATFRLTSYVDEDARVLPPPPPNFHPEPTPQWAQANPSA